MKALSMLAAPILALLVASTGHAASRNPNAVALVQPLTLVEFVILQNQSVQTVTCTDGLLLADFTGYGHATGGQCTSTGPLIEHNGTLGAFVVDFKIKGHAVHLDGCRLDTVSLAGGIAQYDINCVHP